MGCALLRFLKYTLLIYIKKKKKKVSYWKKDVKNSCSELSDFNDWFSYKKGFKLILILCHIHTKK